MPNPFSTLFVQPSYGLKSSLITWTLAPGYEGGQVYVYRSPTGVPESEDWVLLNPDTPVAVVNFFEDEEFISLQYSYRLLLEHPSGEYDSPIVGVFSEQLTRGQYGLLHQLRQNEYLRMRHNGVPVFHCIPSVEGEYASGYNQYTGSLAGIHCTSPGSFGSWFKNGYKTIVQTRAEISGIAPVSLKEDEQGKHKKTEQMFQLRLLGFPKPEVGHVIVLPYSDRRLVIAGNIQHYELRGFLPVAYDANAGFVDVDDPRYKLELPPLQSDGPYDRIAHTV